MKDFTDVVCCIVDYGTFECLADKLSKRFKKVYYYTPIESEYRTAEQCVIGDGVHKVHRIDDFMEPKIYDEVDLYVFPDIGWSGHQRFLRRSGKAVWGCMGADSLEMYRTKFITFLKEHGLPVINSQKIVGLTNLALHLKEVKDKWIKINKFRGNMETWRHLDWVHSQRMLEKLAMEFGGVKEHVVFVVQDNEPTDIEIGYDGWTVDGEYPELSFSSYEKKNELYIGTVMPYTKQPEQVREVNEAISLYFKEIGYRNFFGTEIRMVDSIPYFIDPTFRMPGLSGEQLLETCDNLDEVIWRGANGEIISPNFRYKFAVEATLHYDDGGDHWMTMVVPGEVQQWFKPVHYCICDGAYQFPPAKNDEIGVVLGVGDTIQEAIDHLKENMEFLKNEPVSARLEGFVDLIKSIEEAEDEGIEFTNQRVPAPEEVM